MGSSASAHAGNNQAATGALDGGGEGQPDLEHLTSEHVLNNLVLGTLRADDDFRLKLERILISKTDRMIFGLFLKDEFCEEMLSFWRAADVYQAHAVKFASMKKLANPKLMERVDEVKLTHAHILKIARLVFDHYVAPGGPEQVNLSQKMVSRIKKQITAGVVTTELYYDAVSEVKKHLYQDKLPRFKAWVAKIGSIQKLLECCNFDNDGVIIRSGDDSDSVSVSSLLDQVSAASAHMNALQQQQTASPGGGSAESPTPISSSRRRSSGKLTRCVISELDPSHHGREDVKEGYLTLKLQLSRSNSRRNSPVDLNLPTPSVDQCLAGFATPKGLVTPKSLSSSRLPVEEKEDHLASSCSAPETETDPARAAPLVVATPS